MCIYKILNTCLLLAASCGAAQAQLALNVEELQPHMGRFKLDVSLAYANAQRTGLAAGSPIVVQTGPASFITLPARVGERSLNTDTVVLSMGLRYGLSPQICALVVCTTVSAVQRWVAVKVAVPRVLWTLGLG